MRPARRQLADDVALVAAGPGNTLNCYVVGGTLIDSGIWLSARRLRRQLSGGSLTQHALTHAHADHAGSTARLCEWLQVPLAVGKGDVAAMESGAVTSHASRAARVAMGLLPVRAHPVARPLAEGDHVDAGFEVVDAPGHSPGAIAFWRERDRLLIVGDVVSNVALRPMAPRVRHVPAFLHADAEVNAETLGKLAALGPAVVGFGHGSPLRDPGLVAEAFASLTS